jgi:hypothetical protein
MEIYIKSEKWSPQSLSRYIQMLTEMKNPEANLGEREGDLVSNNNTTFLLLLLLLVVVVWSWKFPVCSVVVAWSRFGDCNVE